MKITIIGFFLGKFFSRFFLTIVCAVSTFVFIFSLYFPMMPRHRVEFNLYKLIIPTLRARSLFIQLEQLIYITHTHMHTYTFWKASWVAGWCDFPHSFLHCCSLCCWCCLWLTLYLVILSSLRIPQMWQTIEPTVKSTTLEPRTTYILFSTWTAIYGIFYLNYIQLPSELWIDADGLHIPANISHYSGAALQYSILLLLPRRWNESAGMFSFSTFRQVHKGFRPTQNEREYSPLSPSHLPSALTIGNLIAFP